MSEAENPQLGRGILLSPVEDPDAPQSGPQERERARNAYAVGMDTIETSLSGSRSLTVGRRTVVGLLLGAASGSLAAACAPWTEVPPTTPGARLQDPITYVAMGASDAAGVGVDRPSVDGWVPVLGRLLPPPVRVVNLGIPGIRLREAAIVQTGPALESKPNLITVWLVVNDILNGVTVNAYEADLDALLTRLKAETAAEIAVGNVPDAPDGSGYLGLPDGPRRQVATRWNGVIGEAVAKHGVTLVDLWSKWPLRANPKFIGPDGLHPTVAGYRALAQVFRDTLRAALVV